MAAFVVASAIECRLSESYLERMNNEQFAGRRKAVLRKVVVQRKGRPPFERFTLIELEEIDKKNPS
jgi:hypothetical protein